MGTSGSVLPCRSISIHAFGGDRTVAFERTFRTLLDAEKRGGTGPSPIQCLLHAGHAGLSLDATATIYGFNPDGAGMPTWEILNRLKNGEALPGIVRDDTVAFAAAKRHGLVVFSMELRLPLLRHAEFEAVLDGERSTSRFTYGFPNGNGDCNCVTWLERMGLPRLTGRMNEFAGSPAIATHRVRRFGECI